MYTGHCPLHRAGRFSFCVYISYRFLLFLVFTWMEEIFFSKTFPSRVYLNTHNVTGSEEFSRCARHFFAGILTYFKEK